MIDRAQNCDARRRAQFLALQITAELEQLHVSIPEHAALVRGISDLWDARLRTRRTPARGLAPRECVRDRLQRFALDRHILTITDRKL